MTCSRRARALGERKRLAQDKMCIKVCDECVLVSTEVCVCGERERREAGLSSCALSIIHDLTLKNRGGQGGQE